MNGKVFAVDLDGTIAEETKENWRNYAAIKPRIKEIEFINKLSENNIIIIYTARPEEDFEVTREWLIKNNVKYNILVMGKLKADFYVDDRAITIENLMELVKL